MRAEKNYLGQLKKRRNGRVVACGLEMKSFLLALHLMFVFL